MAQEERRRKFFEGLDAGKSVSQLNRELGIATNTGYNWQRKWKERQTGGRVIVHQNGDGGRVAIPVADIESLEDGIAQVAGLLLAAARELEGAKEGIKYIRALDEALRKATDASILSQRLRDRIQEVSREKVARALATHPTSRD